MPFPLIPIAVIGAGMLVAGAVAKNRALPPTTGAGAAPPPNQPPATQPPADSGGGGGGGGMDLGGGDGAGAYVAAAILGAGLGDALQAGLDTGALGDNKVTDVTAKVAGAAGGIAFIAAGGGTALAAGTIAGAATAGKLALPIIVIVVAVVSISNNIEDITQKDKLLKWLKERDALLAKKKFREAWDYACDKYLKEGTSSLFFYRPDIEPEVPLKGGGTINVKQALDIAYTEGLEIKDSAGNLIGTGGKDFGDRTAEELQKAQPWTRYTGGFKRDVRTPEQIRADNKASSALNRQLLAEESPGPKAPSGAPLVTPAPPPAPKKPPAFVTEIQVDRKVNSRVGNRVVNRDI